jgi:DNA primase catalytic subunit
MIQVSSDIIALRAYYQKNLFPYALIHRMLTLNTKSESGDARIIAVQAYGDEGVFVLYDYKRATVKDFRSRILTSLSGRVPQSFHMGLFRKNYGNKIVQSTKELVFDLDITDFNRYCACGKQKKLCSVCWVQMQLASLILDHRLKHELGYKDENRLWVFSGSKGVHCFINARNAMSLNDKEREQLYKRLYIGYGDDTRLTSFLVTLCAKSPEFVERVEHFFLTHMLKEQDIFTLPAFVIREDDDSPLMESFEILCLRHLRIHHRGLAPIVKSTWDKLNLTSNMEDGSSPCKKHRLESNISVRKWRALKQLEELRSDKSGCAPSVFLMFVVVMPMIDKGPMGVAHQIKLPFSVHHRTKNLSLPMTQQSLMSMQLPRDTVSLETLIRCEKEKQPLPIAFNTGLKVLEEWLNAYPC